MVFTVEMDGESIACCSAHCVNRLLRRGWRLSDPAQQDLLEQELAASEEPSGSPHGPLETLAAQD